jgi:hypothetical protein
MTIFDLLLILSVFVIFLTLLGMLIALITRRWMRLKQLGLFVGIYVSVYALLLVSLALFSPQQVLAMHQLRCFDDWCASVEMVELQPSIGRVEARGAFYIVTLRVSSRAKRITQRALDAGVYLLDKQGKRYDVSIQGQQALEAAGLAGLPLNSPVDAGASFTSTTVFDLPSNSAQPSLVITHGAFPGIIIIGDDQSFLHKPTIIQLTTP